MGSVTSTNSGTDAILIVDDEVGIRKQLKWGLAPEYRIFEAQNEEESLAVLEREKPNLITLDITLSNNGALDGLAILEKIMQFDPHIKVIVITGHDEKEIALKAIQLGAYDYYQKPIVLDELKTIIRRALYIQKLERENEALAKRLQQETQFEELIGDSPQMLEVYEIMRRVLTTDVPVLITGESGTGKELVARAIHYQSSRKDKPFIPINCGAIPENLLESELFGHERGSFTGAYYQKKGKFELAHQGTAFLDEIGELSPTLQVKLLRFLQEKEIERVGGKEPIMVDVRILAATNKDLEQEINLGHFRADLYYRLGVISIHLPPLRERGDDILLLANRFLAKYATEYDKPYCQFDALANQRMYEYRWPGNVRELENRIKRAVIMSRKKLISAADLGLEAERDTKGQSLMEVVDDVQKKYITQALTRTRGNVSRAARELGISRVALYDLIDRFRIQVNDFRRKRFQF
ncbi:MAG: PEP-CTERM-box response regulator transcription factor [candidate division KSB1 bacterium]|nr:PEP-CTERM-box response regulator transcription factor [candidate division KSB1 bacterium]MDZ7341289.1 PEP-CTERM-box response regulator transcription factor [candidate division KSB1 bacterium]